MQSGFEPLPRTPELRVSRVGHRDVKLPLLLDEAVEALMHSGGGKLRKEAVVKNCKRGLGWMILLLKFGFAEVCFWWVKPWRTSLETHQLCAWNRGSALSVPGNTSHHDVISRPLREIEWKLAINFKNSKQQKYHT